MEKLTLRQSYVLQAIKKLIAKNGYPPTVREIGEEAHLSSPATIHFHLKKLEEKPGLVIYNLGTGKGTSVLELVHAFEKATGKKIPYQICPRRPGDVAENYANCDKAFKELGWKAKYDIVDACRDSWNWQSKNPNGFEK